MVVENSESCGGVGIAAMTKRENKGDDVVEKSKGLVIEHQEMVMEIWNSKNVQDEEEALFSILKELMPKDEEMILEIRNIAKHKKKA